MAGAKAMMPREGLPPIWQVVLDELEAELEAMHVEIERLAAENRRLRKILKGKPQGQGNRRLHNP